MADGFITKIDYSNNRQIKQRTRTDTTLSGASTFGVPFSALTNGPDPDDSGIINTITGPFYGEFSGNTGTTVITFDNNILDAGTSGLVIITPENSASTQNTGDVFSASSTTIIDGNTVNLSYSGVNYDLIVTSMTETGVGIYTGETSTPSVDILSADTLDYTGRTIWVHVPGIMSADTTYTGKLNISDYTGTSISPLGLDANGFVVSASSVGTVINPTDNYIPYRSDSLTFLDSPIETDGNNIAVNRSAAGSSFPGTTTLTVYTDGTEKVAIYGDSSFSTSSTNKLGGRFTASAASTNFFAIGVHGNSGLKWPFPEDQLSGSKHPIGVWGTATEVDTGTTIDAIGVLSYVGHQGDGGKYLYYGSFNNGGTGGSWTNGSGDSIGFYFDYTDAGSGNKYVGKVNNAGEGNGKVLASDGDGNITLSRAITADTIVLTSGGVIDTCGGTLKADSLVGCSPLNIYDAMIVDEGNVTVLGDMTMLGNLIISGGSNIEMRTETIVAEDNNIDLNYGGNHTTALGGGITVLSGQPSGNSAIEIDSDGYWGFTPGLITKELTPSGTTDTQGKIGETTWDDDYIYVKTNGGWKRSNLTSF